MRAQSIITQGAIHLLKNAITLQMTLIVIPANFMVLLIKMSLECFIKFYIVESGKGFLGKCLNTFNFY